MIWQPITDLPVNWEDLSNSKLRSFANTSPQYGKSTADRDDYTQRQREKQLEQQPTFKDAIDDDFFAIDRALARQLIECDPNVQLVSHQTKQLTENQETAIYSLLANQRDISPSTIKELHEHLTSEQEFAKALDPITKRIVRIPLLKGTWKTLPNNPTRPDGNDYEYAPPEQVESEVDKLVKWHRQHEDDDVPPEIEAAWLHHRFVQIHPFQDGNGRVARALTSIIFIKAGYFPLILTKNNEQEYIEALEIADQGDLKQLIDLFVKCQEEIFKRNQQWSSIKQFFLQSPNFQEITNSSIRAQL